MRQLREVGQTKTLLSFTVLMASATVWCLSRVFQYTFVNESVTWMFLFLVMIGWATSALSLLFFSLAYTGRADLVTRRVVTLSALPVAVGLGLYVTNDLHTLFGPLLYQQREGMMVYINDPSTVYVIYTLYLNGAVFYGVYRLVRSAIVSASLYQKQSAAVVIGAVTPTALGIFFLTELTPFVPPHIDLTPIGFAVTGLCFGYAVFEYGLLDLVPIGRRTAWNKIGDAVVTLDGQDRVVDANLAARRLFGVGDEQLGMPATEFFEPIPDDQLQTDELRDVETQVTFRVDGETSHFMLSISTVGDDPSEHSGRVVVLRDITPVKRREEELDLLRQVQSRVLRHNIRNELTTIRGNIEILADRTGDEQYLSHAVEASEDLLSISRKARLVEEIVDGDTNAVECDLRKTVEQTIATVREQYPDVDITFDGPEHCTVEASSKLEIAIENLLENAAEHNDRAAPEISVRLDASDPPQLTIADNGPGIPPAEVAVLEDGQETDLEHGSGIGLWLVTWIVDRSDAALTFETSEEGTEVTIQFQTRADEIDNPERQPSAA